MIDNEIDILEGNSLRYLQGLTENKKYLTSLIEQRTRTLEEDTLFCVVYVQVLKTKSVWKEKDKDILREIYYNIFEEVMGELDIRPIILLRSDLSGSVFVLLRFCEGNKRELPVIADYLNNFRVLYNKVTGTELAIYYTSYCYISMIRGQTKNLFKEVYENVPQIAEYDREIASLAVNATRLALSGDASAKDSLREDIQVISEKKRAALLMNRYPGDYLDEIFTCPICKDTGFVHGKPCECLKSEIINLIYSRSELNEILAVENFDNFNFDFYSDDIIDEVSGISSLENMETIVDRCHYFINNFDKHPCNLLFYGRAGTGKTFLINCIAKELIDKSYSVIYLSAVQFFDLLADYSFRR
ncbi:MAG: hypothetical protein HP047_09550 [Lachnospira sp.]|nr:hypothetical protein [Lachnospira sp.]